MATYTANLTLRKPDGVDFVSRLLDVDNNLDALDALFSTSTGHAHSGSGTSGKRIQAFQDNEGQQDAVEAATLDTLGGGSHLINNLNRIRYWLTQISGQALGTVTTSLNTHATSAFGHSGITAFAIAAIVLGTAAGAGSATTALRSDATIIAFDAVAPTASAVGDAATAGTQPLSARRDHLHGREAFGTATAIAIATVNGTALTVSHSDHVHAHGALGTIANAHAAADITNAAALNVVNAFTKQYYATIYDNGTQGGGTYNIDWDRSNFQIIILTAAITFTFSNVHGGGRRVLVVTNSGAARVITWPGSVSWPSAVVPTPSGSGKKDQYGFNYDSAVDLGSMGLNY